MVVAVALYGWFVWPHARRHVLTDRERRAFEKPLAEQNNHANKCIYSVHKQMRVPAYTPPSSPICLGRLVRVVKGNVARKEEPWATRLPESFSRKRGTGHLDPNNWRSGLWMNMSPSLGECRSHGFAGIGVQPDSFVDSALSEDEITVYFGPEKENAAERTSLTDSMERLEMERRKGTIPARQ